MASLVKRAYEIAGLGKFGSNSHPVHPATVHFPLAFLALANILNLIYGAALYLPTNLPVRADKENLATLTIAGYFVNVLGIIASIPALLSGFAELYAMVSIRGIYRTNGKTGQKATMDPIVKTTLTHAGLNDVVVVGAIYNWLMERNVKDYTPAGHQIIMSAGALGMAFYAAYLGGGLVYSHGVGVQRMGSGGKEKRDRMIELIEKKE